MGNLALATREAGQLAERPVFNLAEVQQIGQIFVKSGFFQDSKDASQAIVKIMAGSELGFGPMASMTGIYIVKGKVSLSANLMAAAVKRSGRYNFRVREHSAKICKIEFFEGRESVGVSEFTWEEAHTGGLTGNDTWKKFPRNMLFARAMSNGVKWYCSDIFAGPVYTPDELGEAVNEEGEIIRQAMPNLGGNNIHSPIIKTGEPEIVDAYAEVRAKLAKFWPSDDLNYGAWFDEMAANYTPEQITSRFKGWKKEQISAELTRIAESLKPAIDVTPEPETPAPIQVIEDQILMLERAGMTPQQVQTLVMQATSGQAIEDLDPEALDGLRQVLATQLADLSN